MRVTGFKEVDAVLKGLPYVMSDKVFKSAHSKALEIFVAKERLLAPVGLTSNLVESIGVVKERGFGSLGLGAVQAGPRRKGGYKGFAGHLIEYGTKVRATHKGANRGRVTPHPFAEPAWEATKDAVEVAVNQLLAVEVVKFMKRTLKA